MNQHPVINIFKGFLRNVKKQFYDLLEPWKPDSFLVAMWRLIVLGLILAQTCLSTYIVCFLPEEKSNFRNTVYLVDFIGDMLFILEVLSRFQIGYYYHGELHIDRQEIVYNYVSTSFFWDFLSLGSIVGRLVPSSAWENLILLVNLRLYKLRPLITAMEDFFQFSKEALATLQVVKLSVVICVLAHYCSCLLYIVTKIEDADDNWIARTGNYGKPEDQLYVLSLYWSVTTMATVGYGDIAPVTILERLLLVGIMILTSIVFGYILSTIGALLLEVSAYSQEAKHKIRIITKYMNDKALNKDIQSKIRKYLEFYLNRENAARIEGDGILRMLSVNLQEEIVREVNAKVLSDSYMFSSNFRKRFLYIVSKDLIERSFGPDETVFNVRGFRII